MASELDYLLAIDMEGVITFDDSESLLIRIKEWLHTKKGEMWGAPHWGNTLEQFKHEPVNSYTAAAIENHIIMTLPKHVAGVVITEIRAEPIDFDYYHIIIGIAGSGYVKTNINLKQN